MRGRRPGGQPRRRAPARGRGGRQRRDLEPDRRRGLRRLRPRGGGARAGPGDDEQPHGRRRRASRTTRRSAAARAPRATADGPSGVHVAMSNTLNTPVEALETAYPLRVEAYRLRRGSGGAGAHRGGDGVERRLRLLADAEVSVIAERRRRGPSGRAGGADGAPGRTTLNGDELPAKWRGSARAGDVVVDRDARAAAATGRRPGAAEPRRGARVPGPRRSARLVVPRPDVEPERHGDLDRLLAGRRWRRRGRPWPGAARRGRSRAGRRRANDAPCSDAPARSRPSRRAPSQRASVRSASRRRTSRNDARRRSAPRRATKDQSPPSTFSSSYVQRSNVLPTSLQPVNVVSKKRQRVNVQFRKAASTCAEPLKRQSRKVQPENEAPRSGGVGEVDADERHVLVAPVGEVAALPVLVGDLVRRAGAHAAQCAGRRVPRPSRLSRRAARCRAPSRRRSTAGCQPSSRLALAQSMIAGWLAASTHSATGGRNGQRRRPRARPPATGRPGTGTGASPTSRASLAPRSGRRRRRCCRRPAARRRRRSAGTPGPRPPRG